MRRPIRVSVVSPVMFFSVVGALGQLVFVCLFSVHIFRSQIQRHGIISKKPDTKTRLRIHAADHSFRLHTILKHQFTGLCCVSIILYTWEVNLGTTRKLC